MATPEGGNDRSAALTELADKFGQGTGRAEQLIDASRARYQGDLGKAQNLPVDEEASEELRDDLSGLAKTVEVDEKRIITASVRGPYALYVYADSTGREVKEAVPLEAVGKTPKAAEKVEVEDPTAPSEDAQPGDPDGGEAASPKTSKGRGRKKA